MVPPVVHLLPVAPGGPIAPHGEHLHTGTGRDAADAARRDADDVPLPDVHDVVVHADPARSGHDHVDLLLLGVPMTQGGAEIRRIAEIADSKMLRVEVAAAEARVDAVLPAAGEGSMAIKLILV